VLLALLPLFATQGKQALEAKPNADLAYAKQATPSLSHPFYLTEGEIEGEIRSQLRTRSKQEIEGFASIYACLYS
jgi:hypothetical protein